jgi:hypothetical protein
LGLHDEGRSCWSFLDLRSSDFVRIGTARLVNLASIAVASRVLSFFSHCDALLMEVHLAPMVASAPESVQALPDGSEFVKCLGSGRPSRHSLQSVVSLGDAEDSPLCCPDLYGNSISILSIFRARYTLGVS